MGMGYAGCQVLTIDENFIKEQCPMEFQELMDSFDPIDGNPEYDCIDDLAIAIEDGTIDPDEEPGQILLKYIALQKAFEEKTDLKIDLLYHDPEKGDRYDDFSGQGWEVNGVYQYTPAGEKYKKHITNQSYVTFG